MIIGSKGYFFWVSAVAIYSKLTQLANMWTTGSKMRPAGAPTTPDFNIFTHVLYGI